MSLDSGPMEMLFLKQPPVWCTVTPSMSLTRGLNVSVCVCVCKESRAEEQNCITHFPWHWQSSFWGRGGVWPELGGSLWVWTDHEGRPV